MKTIETLPLFPLLDKKLIELLRSLSKEDWNKPTLAKLWTVKDIASHLLDGNFRTISLIRDGYNGMTPGSINSYQDIVSFLNNLNGDWVKATKRMSPKVITDLLEETGKGYLECLTQLKPFEKAMFSVAWAGEEESLNWFHIAREFTEKWHHHQQIREAVNQQGIMNREFYFPMMDTFMRALPHTYRNTSEEEGTQLSISVTGDAGGEWILEKVKEGWVLSERRSENFAARVTIPPAIAWKLFTKGIDKQTAESVMTFEGDQSLGKVVLNMVSVMA
jgi:uncharacterized protein (TIGR03083 family)